MEIRIIENDIGSAVAISRMIPEFYDPHGIEEYQRRLAGKNPLILVASINGNLAGFKIGYDKFSDGSFYSWMGGVLPKYRKMHIAKALASYQEEWAKKQGFTSIIFKTRNKHRAMLQFGLANGFSIIGFEARHEISEHRILLQKNIM